MTKEEKALLDMIAFAEGTIGISLDGYDIAAGHKKIIGWTDDTEILHNNGVPNSWFDKKSSSDAAGRYQISYRNWLAHNNNNKNIPITRINQINTAIVIINKVLGIIDKTKLRNNIDDFQLATDRLANVWFSIPLKQTGKSIRTNHESKLIKNLFEIYKLALLKYVDDK